MNHTHKETCRVAMLLLAYMASALRCQAEEVHRMDARLEKLGIKTGKGEGTWRPAWKTLGTFSLVDRWMARVVAGKAAITACLSASCNIHRLCSQDIFDP